MRDARGAAAGQKTPEIMSIISAIAYPIALRHRQDDPCDGL
jgi:hypothetical protein